jgi:hypothetical protein
VQADRLQRRPNPRRQSHTRSKIYFTLDKYEGLEF